MSKLIDAYQNFLTCPAGNIQALPPASPEEIEIFSNKYHTETGHQPPDEWLALAKIASGVRWNEPGMEGIDLLSIDDAQDPGTAFTYGIAFLPDGAGNDFLVDVTSDGQLGPVIYVCHDPLSFTIFAPSLQTFFERETKNAIRYKKVRLDDDDVFEQIFNFTDIAVSYDQVMAGKSRAMKAYAEKIGPDHFFIDFRTCKTGLSFHHHPTRKEPMAREWPPLRDGDNLIFAIPLVEHPPTIMQRIKGLFGKPPTS